MVLPVLQKADDRNLREKIYTAYNTRASETSPGEKDYLPIIEELLKLR